MAERSKLPWSFLPGDDNEPATDENSIGSICDAEETYIARIWADGDNPEADADFIVRAVNYHDRLVKAFALAVDRLDNGSAWADDSDEFMEMKALLAELEMK